MKWLEPWMTGGRYHWKPILLSLFSLNLYQITQGFIRRSEQSTVWGKGIPLYFFLQIEIVDLQYFHFCPKIKIKKHFSLFYVVTKKHILSLLVIYHWGCNAQIWDRVELNTAKYYLTSFWQMSKRTGRQTNGRTDGRTEGRATCLRDLDTQCMLYWWAPFIDKGRCIQQCTFVSCRLIPLRLEPSVQWVGHSNQFIE